jgi:PilZ domain
VSTIRRDHPRYDLKVSLRAGVALMGSRDYHDYTVENISETGVYLSTKTHANTFNAATIVSVKIELPELGVIEILGKIVRWADAAFGLRIVQIEEEALRKLRQYIVHVKSNMPEISEEE